MHWLFQGSVTRENTAGEEANSEPGKRKRRREQRKSRKEGERSRKRRNPKRNEGSGEIREAIILNHQTQPPTLLHKVKAFAVPRSASVLRRDQSDSRTPISRSVRALSAAIQPRQFTATAEQRTSVTAGTRAFTFASRSGRLYFVTLFW